MQVTQPAVFFITTFHWRYSVATFNFTAVTGKAYTQPLNRLVVEVNTLAEFRQRHVKVFDKSFADPFGTTKVTQEKHGSKAKADFNLTVAGTDGLRMRS